MNGGSLTHNVALGNMKKKYIGLKRNALKLVKGRGYFLRSHLLFSADALKVTKVRKENMEINYFLETDSCRIHIKLYKNIYAEKGTRGNVQ